jgi:threonine/homoserine/homoserine lactone efflux protein
MGYFLEGLILGLGLAISLGPIFITLTQVSIDRGIKGGLTVGAGIWISDIIFITFFYNFINIIRDTIESPAFLFWMGLSGAIVLCAFGVFMLVKQPVLNYSQEKLTVKNYIGLFTKGFMVNSINPFTFVYWMGVTSTYMIGQQISESSMITLLLTILAVIILSDSIKVLLAHFLRSRLTVASANVIFNISGAILICFGLYMFVQVI